MYITIRNRFNSAYNQQSMGLIRIKDTNCELWNLNGSVWDFISCKVKEIGKGGYK